MNKNTLILNIFIAVFAIFGLAQTADAVTIRIPTCRTNQDCMNRITVTSGNYFCKNGNIWRREYAGICMVYDCSFYLANEVLAQKCAADELCHDAECVKQDIACYSNSDCGSDGYTGSPFCLGGNIYQRYKTYTCTKGGTLKSRCTSSTTTRLSGECGEGLKCSYGACIADKKLCKQEYQKKCVGKSLYWYDSCGKKQELINTCKCGCSNGKCK